MSFTITQARLAIAKPPRALKIISFPFDLSPAISQNIIKYAPIMIKRILMVHEIPMAKFIAHLISLGISLIVKSPSLSCLSSTSQKTVLTLTAKTVAVSI